IPLPAYPFEGKSFWISPGKAVAAPAGMSRRSDLTDWFQSVSYVEAPLVVSARPQEPRIRLILAEDGPEAKRLAKAVGPERIVIGTPGKMFGERLDGTWRIDFGNPDHYVALLQYMEESVGLPDQVVLLTGRSDAKGRGASERDFLATVFLFQALGGISSNLQVSVVTTGATGAGGGRVDPAAALAIGPVLVAPREFDHIRARCIDLPAGKLSSPESRRLTALLAQELRADVSDTVVGLALSGRWARRTSPLPLPPSSESPGIPQPATWARENGVYLITGGLGGIGLEVAEHLARSRPVRLALLAREALPAEPDWNRIIHDEPDSRLARRIARVTELRRLGADVMVVNADVASRTALAAA